MNLLARLLTAFVVAVSATGVGVDLCLADARVALVIGNGAYQNAPALPNPRNDATDVAAALRSLGFDTILATDLDKSGMDEATIRFSRIARTADVAMFYYSGHALQFGGVNYLAPVDARLIDEADLRRMTRVDDVVGDLAQAKNLRILVLDSCRDNPLADQLKRSIGATRGISLQRGLAKIDSPEGMIVAYATQAGRTAEDGDGRNSPYTAAFLKHVDETAEIGSIFRRVSADVYEATNHAQLPELSLSFIGEFYLHGKAELVAKPEDTIRRDFEAAERVNTVAGWDAFLKQYPDGFFTTLARERRTIAAKAAALPSVNDGPPQVPAFAPSGSAVPSPQLLASDSARQRVVLYEENPSDPKGKQYVGTVVWRAEPIKASGNQQASIAVRADIDVPERKFRMTMSFRRNTDSSLPASHTAELRFLLPPDFVGGVVGNVPGMLMKSNEQARGTPLAGLAVKVTDGFFLLGLSNVDADRARNIQLMKERSWFDVPLVYSNQRRAIIAIEKGASGERAFNDAFVAWGQSSTTTSAR
ncbi:caspase family protein [Bradyrhizobium sp.]|uniref:caspase family protein n=1 Tax=Bradyrhizobium sp. TaxID=376 RepID=UPI0025BACB2D|nr:caspase family protein [Bradyrhizobium sp.]